MAKKLKWNLILMSVLYLGLGIFLLMRPSTALNVVCYALGGVVLGVVMILNPFGTMETLVMAIGIILIIEGAINLLSALYTVLAIRRFSKLHPETQSMLESLTGQDLNGDGVIAPDIAPADVEASAVELDHVDESAEVEQEEE